MTEPEKLPNRVSSEAAPAGPAGRDARGPWRFLGRSVRGGASLWGLQLIAAWVAFALAPQLLWTWHLRGLAGWSALPNYWGEMLTGRELWELAVNGGLAQHWSGPWTPVATSAGLLWILWAGWRLQAEAGRRPARLGPWGWGLLDALVIAAPPLALLAGGLLWGLAALGGTGVPALGWVQWVGTGLLLPVLASAFCVQWWLCRLARAGMDATGFRLGGWRPLRRHLGLGFGRFWRHPGQWLALILGGVVLRAGLTLLVLALAWRLGGGSIARVVLFLALQLAGVAANAWLLGWFLRLTALFLAQSDAPAPGPGAREPNRPCC